MKLADAHMHLFPQGYHRAGHGSLFGALELEAYNVLRKSHGIERALAIGYEADGIDPDNNAYLRRLAGERDWLYSLGYVEVGSHPDRHAISCLLDDGHSGIAIYAADIAQAKTVLGWPRQVWDVLAESRALISFNARPEPIQALVTLARDFPDISFLFSHLGLPGHLAPGISDGALRMRLSPILGGARYRNVLVKISGLYATSDPAHAHPHRGGENAVRLLLEEFGPARCLWGSDFSPALDFVSIPQTIDIEALDALSEIERMLVFHDNLVRLLDLCRAAG